jgi:serine/threonine protein kinase
VTNLSDGERASLAEELIRLQIELYRDHCIRQESWMFGRDWVLERRSALNSDTIESGVNGSAASSLASRGSLQRSVSFDVKTVANAAFEIADIVGALELTGDIAAHAAILMYRFTTILAQAHATETQIKIRDLIVACIFIANKTYKTAKWKKLETVLEAAYTVFYPGAQFDATNKESTVWEERIISAEAEILERLKHDITCRGFQWIVTAATLSAGISQDVVKNIITLSVCGAFLAAGPDLWLAYGEQYVFAASAALGDTRLEGLVGSLSLIPIKVYQAAELIITSIKSTGFSKKQTDIHSLFKDGSMNFEDRLARIKINCATMMSNTFGLTVNTSESEQRYRIVRDRNKERRTYLGIQRALINDSILPSIDGIAAESNCCFYIDKNQLEAFYDITLVGSWRAIAIASYLLKDAVKGENKLGTPVENRMHPNDGLGLIQAKGQPGTLRMKRIEDGWEGTIQSHISNQTVWSRKTGGRCCIPGKVKESDLRQGGLRWWIPPRYGPSTSGSICDMFLVDGENKLDALGNLSYSSQGESSAFSMLTASAVGKNASSSNSDRFVAVSLQRWPSEKVAAREQVKGKTQDIKKSKKPRKATMEVGFSPGALQELQLLRQLHGLIESPQGHPNLYLPIGLAMPCEQDNTDHSNGQNNGSLDMKSIDEDIFSLTRSSLENEAAAQKDQKRKDMVNEPHLIFQPTPFILQRFASRKKRMDGDDGPDLLSPGIFASWCFDLLSAVLHCHENGIIVRSFQLDQVVVDHSGVAKLGSLYRSTATSEEKMTNRKILDMARQKKTDEKTRRKRSKRGDWDESDDLLKDPYVSPEMLLGSPKYTKETDMWSLGCMLSHLLLNKAVFPIKGRDRESLLSSMYKILGIPASKNFSIGVKFPLYKKPSKKYVPGIEKALTKMMKERGSDAEFAGAIDLISQMLRLDPEERITAKGGLQHEYISNFMEQSTKPVFQDKFAHEWTLLKNRLCKSRKPEDDMTEQERGLKRNAVLMAASRTSLSASDDDDEDDLYDLGDVLGGEPAKRQKW